MSADLAPTVFVYDGAAAAIAAEPLGHFRRSHFMVIDGIDWPGIEAARKHLIPTRRRFKAPFHPPGMDEALAEATNAIVDAADDLFAHLFPGEHCTERHSSLRPMITGPEPLHFDTYPAPTPVVTAFINVATTPRRYRVGPTFGALIQAQPKAMRALQKEVGDDVSYGLRVRTVTDLPPMPKSGPAHEVALAPGAIWFFNSKTVSHEVVYGEGAIGIGWDVPACGAPTQADLLRVLQ